MTAHRPVSEFELADLVREGKPVHAVGSGTKLHHGPAPGEAAVTVTMRGISQITDYSPGDLVVSVQAGCRLADLQAELGRKGQWLPIDPPYPDATVGGILATHSSGPRRLGYGTVRDLLIGLRVMGPGAVVTRSGGKVVKNVTGYDLHKLHVGGFGSLGILLEATFKVLPKPELTATLVFPCESLQEAHALLLKVHASPLRPVALEAIDGRLKHIVEGRALAIVVVEGTRAVLDRHCRDLERLAGKHGVLEGERADPLWNALRKLPVGLKDFIRVRIAAKPHDLPKILPPVPLSIRAGSGIARADVEPGPDAARKISQWNDRAAQYGGYAVAESAPPDLPDRGKLPWGGPPSALMRSIKGAMDPQNLMNPGRIAV